jgi:hypothetical protein
MKNPRLIGIFCAAQALSVYSFVSEYFIGTYPPFINSRSRSF